MVSFFTYLVFNSGNTFGGLHDPSKEKDPLSLYDHMRELSLNNVGFLQQSVIGKNGNLSWECVSNPYFSEIYHSVALTKHFRSKTSPPCSPH